MFVAVVTKLVDSWYYFELDFDVQPLQNQIDCAVILTLSLEHYYYFSKSAGLNWNDSNPETRQSFLEFVLFVCLELLSLIDLSSNRNLVIFVQRIRQKKGHYC